MAEIPWQQKLHGSEHNLQRLMNAKMQHAEVVKSVNVLVAINSTDCAGLGKGKT